MTKIDVRSEALQAWNEFLGKPMPEVLQSIYKHAILDASARCKWYWSSIRTKRTGALAILIISLVLLAAGTLLPIVASVGKTPEARLLLTQIGVVVLAAAGLLQLANRVFGLSSGWLRYMATVTAMEDATRKFEMDWAAYIVGKKSVLTTDDLAPLLQIAERFENEIAKLQSDETDKWISEFNTNVSLLSDMIDKQREQSEKRLQDAIAQQRHGAIELALTHAHADTSGVIDIDGVKTNFSGTSWAMPDIAPGFHVLTVTANDNPTAIRKIVDVEPGTITHVAI